MKFYKDLDQSVSKSQIDRIIDQYRPNPTTPKTVDLTVETVLIRDQNEFFNVIL